MGVFGEKEYTQKWGWGNESFCLLIIASVVLF